jgi:hypothetical protein
MADCMLICKDKKEMDYTIIDLFPIFIVVHSDILNGYKLFMKTTKVFNSGISRFQTGESKIRRVNVVIQLLSDSYNPESVIDYVRNTKSRNKKESVLSQTHFATQICV